MRPVRLPTDLIAQEIASHMKSTDLARLSATCKSFENLSHRAKRLMRREEVLRCAAILGEIYKSVETQTHVVTQDRCMLRTIAFLFGDNISEDLRFIDPDVYDFIMIYGYPDIPLTWNFFKKMCDMGLG